MRAGEKWNWPWMLFYHIAPANTVLRCWSFNDRKFSFLYKHVEATECKRWDWEGSGMFIYCASTLPCGLAQGGIAAQNSNCYHMNLPLQNNCLELAEASSTGQMSPDFVPALQSTSAKVPCDGKLCLGNSRGLGQEPGRGLAHSLSPESELKGNKMHTGKGASCWLPSCSLLPALWLAEGRFHHPPASWLLRVRSPVGSVYAQHFIHRTQILLTSGVSFHQITFRSIHQVNLCIILGLFLANSWKWSFHLC